MLLLTPSGATPLLLQLQPKAYPCLPISLAMAYPLGLALAKPFPLSQDPRLLLRPSLRVQALGLFAQPRGPHTWRGQARDTLQGQEHILPPPNLPLLT